MKVIVASAGRYHSVYLAKSLLEADYLQAFFYGGMEKDKLLFPPYLFWFNLIVSFADRFFVKFQLDRFVLLSRWYTIRDYLFDEWVAYNLTKEPVPDIFVAWANGCRKSLSVAKKMGAITIVEAGSMHILIQEQILQKEYAKHNQVAACVMQENKDRMLAEYELADFIAVPSEHVRQSFLDAGILKEKVIKIPYGCNVEKFFSDQEKKLKGPMIFLFVGMISLQKGIYYLLKAWNSLSLSRDLAELHIVGNVTDDAKNIVDQHKSNENIFFHGPVAHEKLFSFYQDAHVFLFPSLQEGLAMVIGEAMAAGLVVVCSPNSGGCELLKNWESGLLLDNVSKEELSKKITWCLNNPSQVNLIGKKAKDIAKNYSWADYGIKVMQKYQELINVKINK